MFQKIFGFIIFVLGPLMVLKVDVFYQMIGRIDWAEEKIGPGGTRFFLQVIGIGAFFLGLIMMFGLFNGILEFIFGPLLQRP